MTRSQRRPSAPLNHDPQSVVWARKAKRWTQAALAEAVGVTGSHMCEIEKGTRNAGPDLLARIAEALNCPISMLEAKPPAESTRVA
jgi:transcriptional regulator with XRE-family HTH domain